MDRLTPNPPSPYATANPDYRHIIPSPFFADPVPGKLAPTLCGALAVVPAQTTDTNAVDVLPDGLCPVCVRELNSTGPSQAVWPAARPCTDCGSDNRHDGLCAICRAEKHDAWILEQVTKTVDTIAADEGDPDEKYPALLGIYCDNCGTEWSGDFVVSDRDSKAERLEIVRRHARTALGWSCGDVGDYCPTCCTITVTPAAETGADRVREAVRQACGADAAPQHPITFS